MSGAAGGERHRTELVEMLERRADVRPDLEAVASLGLPEGCIAAGYIRSLVWDELHGYAERSEPEDVDVLYYDPNDLDETAEKTFDALLGRLRPGVNWSCKNQARMHRRNGSPPYPSVEAAMREWPETATAVAVRLGPGGGLDVIAPYGLDDLMNLIVRPAPDCRDPGLYRRRAEKKRWLERWPLLRLER